MPLTPGELLSHYEVIELIGTGGMGEVYRGRDTRLPRDVAVKVSGQAFNDRFAREARVIASLNHPNICTLFDVGPNFLVMELVEGDSLQDRIQQGPIPLEEASRLARQIADALDYAHEHGVVHRDLKPANIKIRPDGVVKVLDFGMAKAQQIANAEEQKTMTLDATQAGTILGTPHYMSPEQAMGRPMDKRVDTWAFGVVFYEMLAGRKPFAGATVQEAIASTLRDAPDLTKVPAQVRRLLRRCLEKDPQDRLRHLGDVMSLIDEAPSVELPASSLPRAVLPPPAPIPPKRTWRRKWLWWAAVAIGIVATFNSGVNFRLQDRRTQVIRFEFGFPKDVQRTLSGAFSISPDGQNILFAGSDGTRTRWYLRRLDSIEIRALDLPVPADPVPAAWSPDSRFIVYTNGTSTSGNVVKADVVTGQSQTLCDNCLAVGAAWSGDGTILLGNLQGISRISEKGGTLTPVVTVNRTAEAALNPILLPDREHFLYTVGINGNPTKVGLRLGSVKLKPEEQSKDWVLETPAGAKWVPSVLGGPGQLLYITTGNVLMARPYDADKLEFAGEATQVATSVGLNQNWAWGAFSASSGGQLVYRTESTSQFQLTWFDRTGKNLGTAGDPALLQTVTVSPDAKHAALALGQPEDLWIEDLAAGTRTRLTSETQPDTQPVWSRDGAWIYYASLRGDQRTIVRRAANGAPGEQIIYTFAKGRSPANLTDVSPDGKLLAFHQNGARGPDLWTLDVTKEGSQPEPLLQTEFQEVAARFSPDGRWYIYRSNESGRNEVYAQAVPGRGAPPGKFLISRDGAVGMARWRRDGREVYFLGAGGAVMAADVTLSPTFQSGAPRKLFEVPAAFRMLFAAGAPGSLVDMTPDGERFLFGLPTIDASSLPFQVTTDWRANILGARPSGPPRNRGK